jgi:hypothetical protein
MGEVGRVAVADLSRDLAHLDRRFQRSLPAFAWLIRV